MVFLRVCISCFYLTSMRLLIIPTTYRVNMRGDHIDRVPLLLLPTVQACLIEHASEVLGQGTGLERHAPSAVFLHMFTIVLPNLDAGGWMEAARFPKSLSCRSARHHYEMKFAVRPAIRLAAAGIYATVASPCC